jgi:hypothetical protein
MACPKYGKVILGCVNYSAQDVTTFVFPQLRRVLCAGRGCCGDRRFSTIAIFSGKSLGGRGGWGVGNIQNPPPIPSLDRKIGEYLKLAFSPDAEFNLLSISVPISICAIEPHCK